MIRLSTCLYSLYTHGQASDIMSEWRMEKEENIDLPLKIPRLTIRDQDGQKFNKITRDHSNNNFTKLHGNEVV